MRSFALLFNFLQSERIKVGLDTTSDSNVGSRGAKRCRNMNICEDVEETLSGHRPNRDEIDTTEPRGRDVDLDDTY